jgi:excisionase family DNA binding protein
VPSATAEQHLPDLLTVAQAASVLQLTPISVYRRCERGELECVRLGAGLRAPVRIRRDDLEAYLNGDAEAPAA